jgi:MFS family permease
MHEILQLLRNNRNYRNTWTGQVVSEIGDHFNNIAVFALAVAATKDPLVVTGVMIARAIPAVLAGPLAGVLLDRMDRKRIMIASDLVRFFVAIGFIFAVPEGRTWLLYPLSALLMGASPFFTAGRSSILPTIASKREIHAANTLTQTTGWTTLTIGAFLGGTTVAQFGYEVAFGLNALSFLVSAICIARLKGDFRAQKTERKKIHPLRDYSDGLRYIWAVPLIFGVAMIHVGWASGGGAAQILFPLFGELVFHRGAVGIGVIWGSAGFGLLIGGIIGHNIGKYLSFSAYKRTIAICYIVHGVTYIVFSQMTHFGWALVFIALSRAAVAVSSVLNYMQLFRTVADEFRGRVFATMETLVWSVMMISMMVAGVASQFTDPRTIGAWSGIISSTTAILWAWLNWSGRLPEPKPVVHADEKEAELTGEGRA